MRQRLHELGSSGSCFYVLLTVQAVHTGMLGGGRTAAPGGEKPDSACMQPMHRTTATSLVHVNAQNLQGQGGKYVFRDTGVGSSNQWEL